MAADGRVRGSKAKAGPAAAVRLQEPDVMRRIAETAYHLWERRGRPHGSDLQDWIEAERIVRGRKA